MANPFHILTLDASSAHSKDLTAWLDGIPLKGLREIEVEAHVGEATTARITLIVQLGDVPNKISP